MPRLPAGSTAFDACVLGVTGDWVIRAVVDCDKRILPPSELPALGGAFGVVALIGLLSSAG